MGQTSELINRLSESATLAMARKTRELKAQGIDIIGLSLGEPDFDTPDFIKTAAKAAIDNNYSHYTPVNGLPEVREAISKKFKRDNGLDYPADQIVISTGAKQTIANIVLSIVNPGDEVLLPSPYWVSYSEIVTMAGGKPILLNAPLSDDFKITPRLLNVAMTDRTKLMIFSSPCNPTGSVYSKEELRGLADVIVAYPDFMAVSDEIYEYINFVGEHHSIASDPRIFDQVITVNGVSKGFAMTGWRLGYMGAPKWVADACTKIQGQITSGASAISQKAAQAAVEADPSEINFMKEAFHKRRDYVLSRLNEVEGIKVNQPEGAFYVFPDVSRLYGRIGPDGGVYNSNDISMLLLNHAHVAVVAGDAFGDPLCIRVSYAASMEQLEKAMDRIEKTINSLEPNPALA